MTTTMRFALLLALASCVETAPLHEPVIEASGVQVIEIPAMRRPKLDVLVVIDDTVTMAPYQDRMATLRGVLAGELGRLTRNWMDLRVAVTSNAGRFRRLPGTETAYLADAYEYDYAQRTNHAGTLADALEALMNTGAANDGASRPLEAMRLALEANSQFLRDDAAFAFITISASDDASPWPVSDYVDWMNALAGGDGQGWGGKLVTGLGIHAPPAPRLEAYYTSVNRFDVSPITPIDDGDLARAVSGIGWFRYSLVGPPCLETEDLDASAPGHQYECTMSALVDDELRYVPECNRELVLTHRSDGSRDASAPSPACWQLVTDGMCSTESQQQVRLRGYRWSTHPVLRFECRSR